MKLTPEIEAEITGIIKEANIATVRYGISDEQLAKLITEDNAREQVVQLIKLCRKIMAAE